MASQGQAATQVGRTGGPGRGRSCRQREASTAGYLLLSDAAERRKGRHLQGPGLRPQGGATGSPLVGEGRAQTEMVAANQGGQEGGRSPLGKDHPHSTQRKKTPRFS